MSTGTADTEMGEEVRLARVKAAACLILDEFLVGESSQDAALFVQDLALPQFHPQFIKRLLTAAMDKPEADQDKAASLVSSLCVRGVVSENDCEAGLELLLKNLSDVTIDVPKAVDYVSRFIEHFLEDKVVPEALLQSLQLLVGAEMSSQINSKVRVVVPLPVTTMKAKIQSILEEYFSSGSMEGALKDLTDLRGMRPGQEVVKRTLVLGMGKKNREKEMASLLLSGMTRLYGTEQFFEGFIRVLKNVDDLALDNPDVIPIMSNFIARAMVDDVLPPAFFDFVPSLLLASNARVRSIASAVSLLMEKQSTTRLMTIWGAGAKNSVEELKEAVKVLVDEYFVEGDLDEALNCVRELDAPHFGHEVVKRIVYQAVEQGDSEKELRHGMRLLKGLLETNILNAHQLTLGMKRSVEGLADLSIDAPKAPERLRTIADWLAFEHLVSPAFEQAVMLKARERAAGNAEITQERVHSFAHFIVEEFLVCQSARDAAQSVSDLKADATMHASLVHKMLLIALDKTQDKQRIVADLLSSLIIRDALLPTAVEAGLEMLLKQLPDLVIDVPRVEDYVVPLLAHFVEDGHVQESILDSVPQLAGTTMGANIKGKVSALIQLPLPVTTMKLKVRSILDDYFVSGDLHSTVADMAELEGKRPGQEAVKRTLVLALELKTTQKERASVLLSAMTRVYGSEQFFEGFIRVLRQLDDLALDTPDVVAQVAKFIARAIVDDVLPPSFVSLVPARVVESSARVGQVMTSVKQLLDTTGATRIVNVWGAGAKSSVEELKAVVRALVDEYFVESELEEAVRCVVELDAPHFGHEVVKRIVYAALERGGHAMAAACALLKALIDRSVMDTSQISKGMIRAVLGLRDLSLDVPAASSSLAALVDLILQSKLITAEFKDKILQMKPVLETA